MVWRWWNRLPGDALPVTPVVRPVEFDQRFPPSARNRQILDSEAEGSGGKFPRQPFQP